jgi:hypothetical protein
MRFPAPVMPRTTLAITLAVMLTLSSTVSFAAWTATGQASTSAANGTVGITSNASIGSALGFTYAATNLTKIGAITLTNTGTVPLEIRNVVIAAQSAATNVPPSQVGISIWAPSSSACGTLVPGTVLASGTLASASLTLSSAQTVATTTPRTLCVATTLNGGIQTLAGKTVEALLTFHAGVAGNSTWVASDPSNRTFTQQVPVTAPVVSCRSNSGSTYGFELSWSGTTGTSYVARWRTSATGDWTAGTPVTSPETFTNFSGGTEIGNGVRQIRIDAVQGGATFEGTPIPVRYESILFFFTTPRCG